MALETAQYISDLNKSNPLPTDQKREGDDHLRLIKSVLQATFPHATSAQSTSMAQVDDMYARTQDYAGTGHNGTWPSTGMTWLSSQDLNNISSTGWAFYDTSCGNNPGWNGVVLTMSTKGNDAVPQSGHVIMQVAFVNSTGDEQNQGICTRFNWNAGGWSAWSKPNYNNTYVRRDGSSMWGNLTVGSGDTFTQLLQGTMEISHPSLPFIDLKNAASQDFVWRLQAQDSQFTIVRYANAQFIIGSDGNLYSNKFGWLSDYFTQFAHANSGYAWDNVWNGNNQWNFNINSNWGEGVYLLQHHGGGFFGAITSNAMGGTYLNIPNDGVVSVGNMLSTVSGGWGTDHIWKLRKT